MPENLLKTRSIEVATNPHELINTVLSDETRPVVSFVLFINSEKRLGSIKGYRYVHVIKVLSKIVETRLKPFSKNMVDEFHGEYQRLDTEQKLGIYH